jgi:hypothetical protein
VRHVSVKVHVGLVLHLCRQNEHGRDQT